LKDSGFFIAIKEQNGKDLHEIVENIEKMIKQKLGDFKTSQIEILKNNSITELVDETVKDQLKEIEVMFSKESFKEIKKILKKD
jgi:hypothetical protein